MKKLITKFAIFLILNVFLSTFSIANAEDAPTEKLGYNFNDVNECVPLNSTDKGYEDVTDYLITIIEEPVANLKGEKTTFAENEKCYKQSDDYIICTCFRNTARYFEDQKTDNKPQKKLVTLSKVATDCSDNGQELAKKFGTDKDIGYRYSCSEVQVIFSKGGLNMISGYIGMLYQWAAGLVGLIAVTVIIISGLQLSLSGGDSSAIESAKKRIVQSIAGIIVLFLSGVILYSINPTFFTR